MLWRRFWIPNRCWESSTVASRVIMIYKGLGPMRETDEILMSRGWGCTKFFQSLALSELSFFPSSFCIPCALLECSYSWSAIAALEGREPSVIQNKTADAEGASSEVLHGLHQGWGLCLEGWVISESNLCLQMKKLPKPLISWNKHHRPEIISCRGLFYPWLTSPYTRSLCNVASIFRRRLTSLHI